MITYSAVRWRTVSLITACGFFTLALALAGWWLWALIPLVFAVAGWMILRKTAYSIGTVGFLLSITTAVFGTLRGLPLWAMVLVVISGLVFWDLDALIHRLDVVEPSDKTREIEKKHLERLGLAVAIGLAASLPGVLLRINFSLAWAIVFGLVVILGIRQVIKELIQRGEKPE